jgi:predicted ATPase with chaperone activity
MLAKRIPTIMPDLTLSEALEVTKIHSAMGTLAAAEGIIGTRPFRSPHHATSNVALVGGGSMPTPGEISLSHQGVLFLDELPSVKYKELSDNKDAEPSATIKGRVEKARAIQRERLSAEGIFYNARMNTKLIKKYCFLEGEAQELLKMAMTELGLSARAYDKILKVSRTIADLADSEPILAEHIAEAIQYRSLDR